MNIKHTKSERYLVYSYLPCRGELFKEIKRWFFCKSYATKQGALKAIQRMKETHRDDVESGLIYKIVWTPSPYAGDEQRVIVYNEEVEE